MSKHRHHKIAKRHLTKAIAHKAEAEKNVNEAAMRVIKADPHTENDIFADRIKAAAVAPPSLVGKSDIHEAQIKQAYLKSDMIDPWRNSYLVDPHRSHSVGIKQHPHNISEMLMRRGLGLKLEEGLTAGQLKDDIKKLMPERPLIDRLHEATFNPPLGLQWVKDPYLLRTTLRKAHCFTLDAETSALMVDFSKAIVPDLDGARLLAVPPFPTTWFQVDNKARLKRAVELGHKLTATAASVDVVTEVGWLITTIGPNEYCMTYVCEVENGMMIPPLSWHWTTKPSTGSNDHYIKHNGVEQDTKTLNDCLLFGINDSNVNVGDAWLYSAPFQLERRVDGDNERQWLSEHEMNLMVEISGELRHMFGLLVALGAGQLGAISTLAPQPVTQGPPVVAKGKTLLPIEHKVLTIKLSKRHTVEKVTMCAITGIKHRWHEVRGHFRTKLNADGTVKWRIPIKPHERGDKRLGRVKKTYKIEK